MQLLRRIKRSNFHCFSRKFLSFSFKQFCRFFRVHESIFFPKIEKDCLCSVALNTSLTDKVQNVNSSYFRLYFYSLPVHFLSFNLHESCSFKNSLENFQNINSTKMLSLSGFCSRNRSLLSLIMWITYLTFFGRF